MNGNTTFGETMKQCTKCLESFPATPEFFYKDKIYLRSYCKKCSTLILQKWQKENPEKMKVSRKKWVTKNSEAAKKWAKENPEKMKASRRKWSKENSEKESAKTRKRKALKLNNNHQKYLLEEVLQMYGTKCHICNLEIDIKAARKAGKNGWENGLHIDHLIALANGGADTLENVRPAHGLCNIKKGAKETATAVPQLERAMIEKIEKR
jgi:5-methylcytosine-specific restriction endonuclease McrA